MAIPTTGGPYATLPAGRHSATWDEVYAVFVENAPFRARRELIYEALRLYARVIGGEFSNLTLWVNGGFVTHKPWAAPNDADVVAVVPPAEYMNMCSSTDCLRFLTLQGVTAQQPATLAPVGRLQPMAGLVDAFVVPDDPAQTAVWAHNWSLMSDHNKQLLDPATHRKGYLEVKP